MSGLCLEMDGEQAAVDEPANRGTEPTQSLCGLLDVKAGVRCRAGERHTQSGLRRMSEAILNLPDQPILFLKAST